MAKKELVEYVRSALDKDMSDKEIRSNLKQAGWEDTDITEALAYMEMYEGRNPINTNPMAHGAKPKRTHYRSRWINSLAWVFGYVWLISGLNKLISGEFIPNFASSIDPNQSAPFFRFVIEKIILQNADLFANMAQYTELSLGVLLIAFGFVNFFDYSKLAHAVLSFTYLVSGLFILNIILTFNIAFPWIDVARIFSEGVSVEYVILFASIVLSSAHFSEFYNE